MYLDTEIQSSSLSSAYCLRSPYGFEVKQVYVWNKKKKSPFLGDADHVSENHDPERAGCGGSVLIMGDADICTADMMRVHHKGLGQKN